MAHKRVRVGGTELAYQLSGPSSAPIVCLNHCFAADHRYWDHHLSAFEGFRILRHDARGHGESNASPGPYSLAMMAGDLISLLDALDIERVHLCGVSMGGMISQTAAIASPERIASLALVNTTSEYTEAQVRAWRDRVDLVLRDGIEPVCAPLMARWFTKNAADRRPPGYVYMEERISQMAPHSFAAVIEAMCGLDTTEGLASLTMPGIVIATKDDPGVPTASSEKMARQLGVTPHWIGPARHLATLEHPETFNELIRRFLLRVT
jgi:3-oxoadipate enol-lactonase